MSTSFADLNPQQIKAVTAMEGPVLVLAGPGSGKTRVLTRRIAHLIDVDGIAPWNILAVTFTNKAASEMRDRVERIFEEKFGPPPPGEPPRLGGLTIGTFHSICARILRIETAAAGFQANWVIYDSADQLALVRAIMREANLDEKRYPPKAIHAYISNLKNELVTPERHQAAAYFEEIAGRVYKRYQDALLANNAMDFDDLLMRTVLLLRNDEQVREKYQQKWRYLLVDEFQDTNAAQFALLQLLTSEPTGNRNLFVVGDEDQSIYRFRGADYRNVQRFRRDYPNAKVILLEQNYRSTQTILDVANAVIANNPNRTPKRLHTDNGNGVPAMVYEAYNEVEEAAFIADEIEKLVSKREFSLGDFAVTYRTNAQSRAVEEALVLRGITYRLIGATRFYERKEVKDALGLFASHPQSADNVALERIINEPARGVSAPRPRKRCAVGPLRSASRRATTLLIVHHGPERVERLLGRPLSPLATQTPLVRSCSESSSRFFISVGRMDRTGSRRSLRQCGRLARHCVDPVRLCLVFCAMVRTRAKIVLPICRNCELSRPNTPRACPDSKKECHRSGCSCRRSASSVPPTTSTRPAAQSHCLPCTWPKGWNSLPYLWSVWRKDCSPTVVAWKAAKLKTWPKNAVLPMWVSPAPRRGSTCCTVFAAVSGEAVRSKSKAASLVRFRSNYSPEW